MKTSFRSTHTLLFISIDNDKIAINNNKKNEKLARFTKLDFIKAIHRVKKLSFITLNTKQAFS